MLEAELQQVVSTVSENQLQGLRTLQEDTNKYLHQLTKIISDSTKSTRNRRSKTCSVFWKCH